METVAAYIWIGIIVYLLAPIIRPGVKSIPIIGDIIDLLSLLNPVLLIREWKKKDREVGAQEHVPEDNCREKSQKARTLDGLPDDKLLEMLNHEDASIRRDAIAAIAQRGNRNSVDRILPMLDDKDEFVRVHTARALAALGDDSVLEPLKKARASVSADIQFHFDEAIAQLSRNAERRAAPDGSGRPCR